MAYIPPENLTSDIPELEEITFQYDILCTPKQSTM
jgi:hypothetical protein